MIPAALVPWYLSTLAMHRAILAAYGPAMGTIRVTRETYLDALGDALDGDRGPQIRAALAPNSLDPAGWPRGARFYVGEHGGYALVGDKLCGLFATRRAQGDALVSDAVRNGARRLDHFDVGCLSELYARHGFIETVRIANWTPGCPDVVYRERVGV